MSALVALNPQFVRSVRLDADFGREDALSGYLPQASSRNVLENVARQLIESKQRAFTWTGPYGGGKSSLGLVLASLVGPNPRLRRVAHQLLSVSKGDPIAKAFPSGRNGWLVFPVVGKRANVEAEIEATIARLAPKRRGRPPAQQGGARVIAELTRLAEMDEYGGVLLLIDELGKFLESAAASGDDIHFYQELAEAASRSKGRLVVIGILHQAFDQYAHRLGRDARDEWAKVQGRFADIPVVSGTDEVLTLIGDAIHKPGVHHTSTGRIAKTIAAAIQSRRPGTQPDLWKRLDACWPLHPVTAALLGPSAKRRFGQNERSIFGFLNSAEPLGFKEFIAGTYEGDDSYYRPSQYWDYLKANLEPAILASPDGHRWAQAAEAVERAEARHGPLHVALVKTIGLIELFRNGTGLLASTEVLQQTVPNREQGHVEGALSDLSRAAIIIFRKHLSSWGVYSGSDFDIEAAIRAARSESAEADLATLATQSELLPVAAKRLYRETGTLRWFTRSIVSDSEAARYLAQRKAGAGSSGEFLLLVPANGGTSRANDATARKLSASHQDEGVIVGCATNADRIADLASELAALERVSATRPELEGDTVARREVKARLLAIRSDLEEELRDSFVSAHWFYGGQKAGAGVKRGLSPLASDIAAKIYSHTPHINSELVNRDNLSSNSVKARRDLMYRMLRYGGIEQLGYAGYPADAGLYYTVLVSTGLHREEDGRWKFCPPLNEGRGATLQEFWRAAFAHIATPQKNTNLADIYKIWAAPPWGLKQGLLPILALSFFLAHRQSLAVYIDGLFMPEITEAQIDEWLQDPSRISWRYVHIEATEKEMLRALAEALSARVSRPVLQDPLDSARALVSIAMELPPWTKRTLRISPRAQAIRQLLLKATDPHKVLFNDLPELLERQVAGELARDVAAVMAELDSAYGQMLRMVEAALFRALDHSGTLEELRHRGETVVGIVGELKLDAFATRISQYDGSESAIEGLISLAAQRPSRDWTDRDIDAAMLQLGAWATEFRRDETLAPLRDRPATRRAIAVVIGVGDAGKTVSDSVDVADSDSPAINALADQIFAQFDVTKIKREVALAALAEAGVRVIAETGKRGGQ